MRSAGFGAIKLVQKRTGAARSVCKAALESQLNEDGDIDEEIAIACRARTPPGKANAFS